MITKMKLNFLILTNNKNLLLLLPILYAFFQVVIFGVNVVYWDEWEIVRLYEDISAKGLTLAKLFAQHNEHRIFFPKIILLISGQITHWNVKVNMYIIQVMMIVIYVIYMKYCANIETLVELKGKLQGSWKSTCFRLLLGLCCFSAVQWQNFLWGFQVGFVLPAVASVLSFYFYQNSIQNSATRDLVLSLTFGIVASFSSIHGLGIWVVYAGMFLLLLFAKEKKCFRKFALILLTGITCATLYLRGYTNVGGHPSILGSSLWDVVKYFWVVVGSISCQLNYKGAMLLGGVECLIACALTVYLIAMRRISDNYFAISIMFYGFAVSGMISLGRAGFGIEQALASSRYTTFAMLSLIGLLMIAYREFFTRKAFRQNNLFIKILCSILILLSLCTIGTGIMMLKREEDERVFRLRIAAVLKNYDQCTLANLKWIYPWDTYQSVYDTINLLQKNNFNVFYGQNNPYKCVDSKVMDSLTRVSFDRSIGLDINTIKWDERFIYLDNPWAADFYTHKEYLKVYVRLNGTLYNTMDHIERPDVARFFSNTNFLRSGFSFAKRIDSLNEGANTFSVIIKLADGISYYETDVYTIYKTKETNTLTYFYPKLQSEAQKNIRFFNIASSIDVQVVSASEESITLITTAAKDPQIVFEPLKHPVMPVALELSFSKVGGTGSMQVFYAGVEESFAEERSITFEVSPEKKKYYFYNFYNSNISRLRLDFTNREGTEYAIQEIRLYYNDIK